MGASEGIGRAALTPVVAEIDWTDGDGVSTASFEGAAVEIRAEPSGEWTVRIDGEPVGSAGDRAAAKSLAAERAAADRLRRSFDAQIG
jgi:hypothetical protein